jgi:RNA polymerase subunit RPABC4/transcription elongation factor Spt4
VILNTDTYTRTPSQINQQLTSPDITTISSNLANQATWETKTSLSSDHLPIIITINTKTNFRLNLSKRTFINYKKANWEKFTEEIENNIQSAPTPENVHHSNKLLTNLILLADKHYIPKGKVKDINHPLPQNIKQKIKERNILREKNPSDPLIIPLSKEITQMIHKNRRSTWESKLDQIGNHKKNSHKYWNTINSLKGKHTPTPPNTIITFNNKPAHTNHQKATAFNKQFVNTILHKTKKTNRKIDKYTKTLPSNPITITTTQVHEAISKASNNNSTGPDNINIRHLKHLGPCALQYLTDTLNLALTLNIIPHIWKLAKIIPIPKPNKDPNSGPSYRPISLLSPIAKTMEKVLLPHITPGLPDIKHQHGFKTMHSTTTALHQLTNQITQGFNQAQPPLRTVVVSLDLSKAFDTVNIHSLINKLHQTTVPTTIIKFIANYIKGRKGFTHYQGSNSKQQQFKTGVPQGGVLSPVLFNLYTSDLPLPPTGVTLTTYADDMNPAASHAKYHVAEQILQPYLQDIYSWTVSNDLILNPDKSTATLFTPDTHEHDITLNLSINNVTIPTVKNPKILGLTLDPAFNFSEHVKIVKEKATSAIKILKALTSTTWGKQKETLLATYKTIVLPVIEYASTIWYPVMSDTNVQKLQAIQNNALRIITGCTLDTNTQHLHKETKTLPLTNHLKLHASQLRQKSFLPAHPLHELTQQTTCPRRKKQTIFHDWNSKIVTLNNELTSPITSEIISQNLKTIHTSIVQECLQSYKPNPILLDSPPDINPAEQELPRGVRRMLAQLRTGKSPLLKSYLHKIDPTTNPSPICPLCNQHDHTTEHLFSCPIINTTLTTRDLWTDPVAVAALLQLWDDVLGAAGGGGLGSGLM